MSNIIDDLKAIRQLGQGIERQQEKIARLRSAMEGLNHVMRNCPGSHTSAQDTLSAQMAQLDKLERQLAVMQAEHEVGKHELGSYLSFQVGRLNLTEQQQKVLTLRYLDGYAWKAVAKEMGHSTRRCFQIHSSVFGKLA